MRGSLFRLRRGGKEDASLGERTGILGAMRCIIVLGANTCVPQFLVRK